MSLDRTMRLFRDYLTVKQAADFLGVSPDTLRNWDDTGKLRAIRHPVNGYRLYDPDKLKNLLATALETKHQEKVYGCVNGGRVETRETSRQASRNGVGASQGGRNERNEKQS